MDISLAWDLFKQGRKSKAGNIIKVFQTLMKEKPFNFDDSWALRVKSATNLCREEKNAEALQKFEEIIESNNKFSGIPDCISNCEISIIIVSLLEKLGRQDEATKLQNSIVLQLKEYSEMLGVFCDRYNVYEYFPMTIRIYLCLMAILDPLHESIIFMLSVIGRMLTFFGKYKGSIKLYRKLYETCLADLGPAHPITVNVCISLVSQLRFIGDFELASIYMMDFRGRRTQLSDTRSDFYNEATQIMEYQYANILYEEGRYDEALAKYRSVHDFQKDKLKDHDQLTIDVKIMIRKTRKTKKNYGRINPETINEVWDIPEGSSMERILFLGDLSKIREERGNPYEALSANKEIISNDIKYDSINRENKIAMEIADKNPEEALKRFLTIKEKCKTVRNPEYSLCISYLRGIAKAYHNKGNYQFAIKIYEKIVAEMENTLLPYNLNTLSIKHDLGKSYFAAKRFEDSKKTFLGVRSLRYAVYNHSIHPHCLDIDADIARVELEIRDANQAFKIYCEVYEHTRIIYGENHAKTIEIRREMRKAAKRISVPDVTRATESGNESSVSHCINSIGESVNARNSEGLAPLHIACHKKYSKMYSNNVKMVFCLLKLGANYEIKNWEFKKPCDIAQDEAIKKILEGVDRNFRTITGGREGDDIKYRWGDINVFTVNATDNHGNTCLHYATERGFATPVVQLLQNDPSVTAATSSGYQVFHLAARAGRYEILKILLRHVIFYKKEETCKEMINDNKNDLGYTPLHFAVQGNHLPIIELLLKHGADSTIKCKRDKLPVDLSLREDIKRLCAGTK